MPTILRVDGFRFYFYSDEGNEPAHIHVEKGGGRGKYWLDPLQEDYMRNFKAAEQRKARSLIELHQEDFKNAWNEYFNN